MAPDSQNHVDVVASCENNEETLLLALTYSLCNVFPMALNAANQLQLFDIMAEAGPGARLSAGEIVSKLNTQYPSAPARLDRMLRLLASHSLLSSSSRELADGRIERLYELTPASLFFLKSKGKESSLAALTDLLCHPAPHEAWLHLKDAIVEGGCQFSKVRGMPVFEYMDVDPVFNQVFNDAMAAVTKITMIKIIDTYKGFEGLESLVDVGGGTGKFLSMVIAKYPHIKGINFDLPHVVENATSYPGIENVGGSMFSSVPKAEAIVVKDTLHNWSDENCVKILEKCYESLPETGKVILIDLVLPDVSECSDANKYISGIDNSMMVAHPGGQERTVKEFEELGKAAGFSGLKVACAALKLWAVMELYKK